MEKAIILWGNPMGSYMKMDQIIAGIKTNGIYKTYWSGNGAGLITITRSDLATGMSIY